MDGQGAKRLDDLVEDGLRATVVILEENGEPALPLDERSDARLAMLLTKHQQIALPMAELCSFRDFQRPSGDTSIIWNEQTAHS